MPAIAKTSPADRPETAAETTSGAPTRVLSLAAEDSAPGVNVVADHNEMLEAAFGARQPMARYPGAVRVVVIGGGSALLWGAIALLIRGLLRL